MADDHARAAPGAVPTNVQARRRGRRASGSADALTREAIVAAALRMVDEHGLEAFSVRDLARSLGVYPASVYWHVRSRNQLLAAMVAHVLRDVAPDLPSGNLPGVWQDWIRDLFRRYRRAIQAHPAVAPLIGAQLVSNASLDFGVIERTLEVLDAAGFRGAGLVDAFSVVTAAQVGFVTLEFAPVPRDGSAEWTEEMRALVHSADGSAFPLLSRNLHRMANRSFTLRWENGVTAPMDRAFDLYVETVVAGLERIAAAPPH